VELGWSHLRRGYDAKKWAFVGDFAGCRFTGWNTIIGEGGAADIEEDFIQHVGGGPALPISDPWGLGCEQEDWGRAEGVGFALRRGGGA
jgi:hypothetical protein